MKYQSLLLHIPHSSTAGIEATSWPKTADFQKQVNKWTDWATDQIFSIEAPNATIHTIIFPMSRFVLDVERLPEDPLESVGQGRIYRQFAGHHRTVTPDEETRLLNLYRQHQQQIQSHLTPETLLIDCHSFPSELSDIDICIGYNDDWSRPPQAIIDQIARTYTDAGYQVGINNPYSNSISPKCAFPYHSIMIELNKRTYWDEATLQPTAGAAQLHRHFVSLCHELLASH